MPYLEFWITQFQFFDALNVNVFRVTELIVKLIKLIGYDDDNMFKLIIV